MPFAIPNNGKPQAAIKGPFIPWYETKEEFLAWDLLGDDRSNFILFAYIGECAKHSYLNCAFMKGEAGRNKIAEHIRDLLVPGADGVIENAVALKAAPNYESHSLSSIVIGLISAAKKTKLETEHLNSYYASFGVDGISTSKICLFINSMRGFFPEITSTNGYEDIRYDNTWQDYREGRTSFQGILRLTKKDMLACTSYTEAQLDVILALDCKIEANISKCPEDLLFAMATYMEAAGKMPGKWYQGNKALDRKDPKKVKACIMGWKRYFELGSDETAVVAAKTKAEVATALGNML